MADSFSLGQYRIGKSIGEGTFGKVRLGVHTPTGQKVAVKTLQKEKIVEQADIERVTRQICILKILRHPNVIQLYEIIETKTDIHLIMQYAEGGELFDYIVKRKRLDEKQSIKFMQQIISGVQYIHKNGIVHRDLKPQNLLLDHNGAIKIVDFGLSNQYKQGEKLKTACGSPCYAAPQMIAGKRYQCLGADIWSCGIILYAMLCGYLPFQDPNTSKLYKKIMAGEYQTPRILSAESKQILKGILNTNPQKRYGIKDIRGSKWYGQLGKNYSPSGIVIGKDSIQVDQRLVKKMAKYSGNSTTFDPAQAKTFIQNNRHNQSTALYYLLKVKADRDPSFIQTPTEPQKERRQDSPLIHRPQTKPSYYMPLKNRRERENQTKDKDNSRNDSLNVSNIISSLVEANKGKLVGTGMRFGQKNQKKQNNFDKLEEFKLFPNKKNSSIYEPRLHTVKNQQRSIEMSKQKGLQKEKSERQKTQKTEREKSERNDKSQSKTYSIQSSQRGEEGLNKKRQELSQQLKQISFKIDQEISQLRKQNPVTPNNNSSANSSLTKKRQTTTNYGISSATRTKTQQNSMVKSVHHYPHKQPLTTSKDIMNMSKDGGISSRGQTAGTSRAREQRLPPPKIHYGPFNAQCIFMEQPKSLLQKVINLLSKLNVRYTQPEAYCLSGGGLQMSIESVQGISGLHLIKFQGQHPLNEAVLQVLSK